jgi:hypothetical protein
LELQMRTLHQALTTLQRELSQGDGSGHRPQTRADRVRADRVGLAIDHVEAAIRALDLVSRE